MRKLIRLSKREWLKLRARRASQILVTPYTGFILSSHFLSQDILDARYYWLNPKSLNLQDCKIISSQETIVLYCQTNQVSEFVNNYLHKIKSQFVLITGRDHWSRLSESKETDRLLSHPLLKAWY
jgi:hypothetical protein